VSLFTDHANLVYIFDPYGQNPSIGRHTANKLMRWALKLSAYRYVIEHLPGDRNVWADILTRWGVKPCGSVNTAKIAKLMYAPICPSASEKYDWPKMEDVARSQQESSETAPRRFRLQEGILQDSRSVVWVPRADQLLKLRLLIASHTGVGGHRGISPSLRALEEHFYWQGMQNDVKEFCKSCLHCLCTSSGKIIPRPLGSGLHADKPNRILHFDYCYIGRSDSGEVYILILKDDLSSYVWLIPCKAADAETTVDCLLRWFCVFRYCPKMDIR